MSVNIATFIANRYGELKMVNSPISSKMDIAKEREKLLEEIRLKRDQHKFLDSELKEKKKALFIPMPSHNTIMTSDLDYQFLGRIMIESKFGGN